MEEEYFKKLFDSLLQTNNFILFNFSVELFCIFQTPLNKLEKWFTNVFTKRAFHSAEIFGLLAVSLLY